MFSRDHFFKHRISAVFEAVGPSIESYHLRLIYSSIAQRRVPPLKVVKRLLMQIAFTRPLSHEFPDSIQV